LSTFRVAVSAETPQDATLALPAERLAEFSASVAAAAPETKNAARPSPTP